MEGFEPLRNVCSQPIVVLVKITRLRMTLNLPVNIQLFQILLLLFAQNLSPRLKRLIHALYTREPNDRTCNPLVDPGKRNMAHLPAMLLCQLLHALNNLVILLGVA